LATFALGSKQDFVPILAVGGAKGHCEHTAHSYSKSPTRSVTMMPSRLSQWPALFMRLCGLTTPPIPWWPSLGRERLALVLLEQSHFSGRLADERGRSGYLSVLDTLDSVR